MGTLFVKEKKISIAGKYKVIDENEDVKYTVEGSFIKIPKRFTVRNTKDKEVAEIAKKLVSLRPKYTVDINGEEVVTIVKKLVSIGDKYKIAAKDIDVKGDWWSYNFDVERKGKLIGTVRKKLLSWGDSYVIDIKDAKYEVLIVAIVIAIDRMMDDEDDIID